MANIGVETSIAGMFVKIKSFNIVPCRFWIFLKYVGNCNAPDTNTAMAVSNFGVNPGEDKESFQRCKAAGI